MEPILQSGLRRVLAAALLLLLLGSIISYLGWSAWLDGQVTIHPKRAPAYVATPNGPHSSTFHLHVWFPVGLGGILLACGLVPVFTLLFGSRSRKEAMLISAAQDAPTSKGKVVPTWLVVVVVLLLILAVLAYAFHRNA